MTRPGVPTPLAERALLAALLAVFVHVVFLGLMVFAVSWQTRPLPVVAEVWDALPGPETPLPPPPIEPPAPSPQPALPRPAPKPPVELAKPKAAESAVQKPQAPARPEPKADIALEKKKQADQALAELEARHKRELAEAARRDEERRRETESARTAALEQQRQQEAEAARALAEQQRQRDQQVTQQARARVIDIYLSQIRAAVKTRLVEPPGLQGNPQAVLKVLQLPSGDVVSARVVRSSGVPAYDEAVERAVLAASPLPLPADRSLFSRDLELSFRPRD